jgi:hypothetical protein
MDNIIHVYLHESSGDVDGSHIPNFHGINKAG